MGWNPTLSAEIGNPQLVFSYKDYRGFRGGDLFESHPTRYRIKIVQVTASGTGFYLQIRQFN